MHYPAGFPAQFQVLAEVALTTHRRKFLEQAPKLPKPFNFHPSPAAAVEVRTTLEELVTERIRASIQDIAQLASRSVIEGLWRADLAVRGVKDLLRDVAYEAYSEAEHLSLKRFPSYYRDLEHRITTSDEWINCLQTIADAAQIASQQKLQKNELPSAAIRPAEDSEKVAEPKGNRGKTGPKPDYDTALRVKEIVSQVAPDGGWRSKLDDIRAALDEAQIPVPKLWRTREPRYRDWRACFEDPILVKAIQRRLNTAKSRSESPA